MTLSHNLQPPNLNSRPKTEEPKMFARLSPAYLATLSSRRPWIVVGLWVVALLLAIGASTQLLDDALTTDVDLTNGPEAVVAADLIEERLGSQEGSSSEIVLFLSETSNVDDPAFQRTVEDTRSEEHHV